MHNQCRLTVLGLAIVLGPLGAATVSLTDTTADLLVRFQEDAIRVPRPPDAVKEWPVVGEKVHSAWTLVSVNLEVTVKRFGPQLLTASGANASKVAGIGFGILGFAVSVLISGLLFLPRPRLAESVRAFARRVAGDRGAEFTDLAGATIRNISRGVIGVALLQTVLVFVILAVFGAPLAGLLAFPVLIFCIVQVGPVPVLLAIIIWAWMTKDTGPGLLLTVLLIPVAVIDNVLKPILMARGLRTLLLVILLGVIGGTVAYGLIGLFLGPIL